MRFDHVGLNVADLDGMTTWYRDAFGLSVELLDRTGGFGG